MSSASRRAVPLAVLVVATALLIASIAWVSGVRDGLGSGRWASSGSGPGTMMGPHGWVAGQGPVDNFEDARRAAGRFADQWGLTVGELMEFDNNYYAELAEPTGELATEVLIDPRDGSVRTEFGPAMMWNTRYGVHRRPEVARVDPKEARAIANDWLAVNRPGEHASAPDEFPGYYTLHTLRGKHITGMLSVNAATGSVWRHSWHGRFVAMDESTGSG